MSKIPQISNAEWEVMKIIWAHSEIECIKLESQSFVNRVFNGSVKSTVLTFVESKEISDRDKAY